MDFFTMAFCIKQNYDYILQNQFLHCHDTENLRCKLENIGTISIGVVTALRRLGFVLECRHCIVELQSLLLKMKFYYTKINIIID